MRRAGFGAPLEELEARAAKGYDATVDELLDPGSQPPMDRDIMMRYKTEWLSQAGLEGQQEEWTFRMINTKRPLQEKIALFWHGVLVTGHAKCEYPKQQMLELDMFRTHHDLRNLVPARLTVFPAACSHHPTAFWLILSLTHYPRCPILKDLLLHPAR